MIGTSFILFTLILSAVRLIYFAFYCFSNLRTHRNILIKENHAISCTSFITCQQVRNNLSEQMVGPHLAQTFLRPKGKRLFRIKWILPFDLASCSTITFTAAIICLDNQVCRRLRLYAYSNDSQLWQCPSFKSFDPPKDCTLWNDMQSIYATQFNIHLHWSFIKPNATLSVASNFSFVVHCMVSKLVSVYDCF
jgi:hypothetical protein